MTTQCAEVDQVVPTLAENAAATAISVSAVSDTEQSESLTTALPDSASRNDEVVPMEQPAMMRQLSCRRCRSTLFVETDLSRHQVERHALNRRKLVKDLLKGTTTSSAVGHEEEAATVSKCTSYFLEDAPAWLPQECEGEVRGKLLCFKCSTRVGSFSWSGAQCSCGTWVTPAFQIPKSKVDERMVKYVPPSPPPNPPSPEPLELSNPECEEEEESGEGGEVDAGEMNDEAILAQALETVTISADSGVVDLDQESSHSETAATATTTTRTTTTTTTTTTAAATAGTGTTDETHDSRSVRQVNHLTWLTRSRAGDVGGMMSMVDESDCSLLTVRKVSLDGPIALRKALDGVQDKFTSVSDPIVGPMQLPSGATRVVYSLPGKNEGDEVYLGEAIWWSDDNRVQHVSRKKLEQGNFESYVQG